MLFRSQKPADWYRGKCTFLLENQEEDREAFEALMRSFFQNLLEIYEKGEDDDGSEGMEREAAHEQEERL